MAIAAGMEGDAWLAAGVALVQVSAEGGGAALQDVAHHLFLRGRRRVLAAIPLAVRAENVGELAGRPVGLRRSQAITSLNGWPRRRGCPSHPNARNPKIPRQCT